MDWASLLTGLKDALPEMGLGGVILWFLILREAAMKSDREHYRGERESSIQHYSTEIDRLLRGRDGETADLQKQIEALRRENETLESRLDRERERRRAAEDNRESATELTLRMQRVTPPMELP